MPSRPYVRDGAGKPHSWDVRADWMSVDPACSAIVTRSFTQFGDFPVWFFNLPADNGDTPHPGDMTPDATTGMRITGGFIAGEPGTFQLVTSDDIRAAARIDDETGVLACLTLHLTGFVVASGNGSSEVTVGRNH